MFKRCRCTRLRFHPCNRRSVDVDDDGNFHTNTHSPGLGCSSPFLFRPVLLPAQCAALHPNPSHSIRPSATSTSVRRRRNALVLSAAHSRTQSIAYTHTNTQSINIHKIRTQTAETNARRSPARDEREEIRGWDKRQNFGVVLFELSPSCVVRNKTHTSPKHCCYSPE